ncbi:TIM-barrel domain-containing protein [Sunxiuqinia sp. A32]|uniref:TIM-barrel domain-containing protein n=1 Tax=Sunxiuqinia sp. A32 TaxID=3461496 RepID=UPI0040460170
MKILLYIALLLATINVKGNVCSSGEDKVSKYKTEGSSVWITTTDGVLRVEPFLPQVLHIQFGTRSAIDSAHSFGVLRSPEDIKFKVKETKTMIRLESQNFSVYVDKKDGCLSFHGSKGKKLLEENSRATKFSGSKPASQFILTPSEAIYGLGQFRDHELNLRGKQRELVQFNTQAAVPVLLSTNGWGIFWDNPSRTLFNDGKEGMSFTSDEGKIVDYYVFTGNNLDELIHAYRELTGEAPMLPYWSLGLHQSRNKYASQKEVLSVAKKMRDSKIPMSSIFIDYHYWGKYGTGSHKFDESIFPDVKGMLDTLHNQYHTKAVMTVWPTFKPGSENYEAMEKGGYLLEGAKALDGTIYDAFNPDAAKLYWSQVEKGLMGLGIDGWFLDGPEPDQVNSFLKTTTFAGPALAVRNLYPLVHSTTFYNGLLKVHPNQRPYMLTRCAWAGQQRNGTAIWSGDIGTDFKELKQQVTAGLSFVTAGIPYWTTDIGGYSGGDATDPDYREVYTRWFQYGTFCPVFRTHGRRLPDNGKSNGPNELWAFGDTVQKICTEYDELRYRLLPYIYSLTAKVTFQDYTPMRLLAFDFPEDEKVLNLKDEFMYGPAFLVCAVVEKGVTHKNVYLPEGAIWIDFWTGASFKGGQAILAEAPISRIPMYVRAGSILPMGPVEQYAGEKSGDPIQIRIYPGANGEFELYEDDGETFNYKKGEYSKILFQWDDSSKTLNISPQKGKYDGMQTDRIFNIVLVNENQGTGIYEAAKSISVYYSGDKVKLKL